MKKKLLIDLILSITIIISLAIYMAYSIQYERPVEEEVNYTESTFQITTISDSEEFIQPLDIMWDDRTIKNIQIYLDNKLEMEDKISILLEDGSSTESQKITLSHADFSTGWYILPFTYEGVKKAVTLRIVSENLDGSLGIGTTATDFMNVGACKLNNTMLDTSAAIKTELTINNFVWDKASYFLIFLYCLGGAAGVFIAKKYNTSKRKGRLMFAVAIGLNFISLIVLDPYFLATSHIAENSLNFYYLTQKYSFLEALFKADAGYLPLLQRLIALLYVKVLGLGTNALYCMQITGVLADIVMVSAFNLDIFQRRISDTTRFTLSLWLFLIFVHPTMSTYFNFVYLGYFLIALLLTCNMEKLKKHQFVEVCILSALICMSKGLYAVMLPVGLIETVFFKNITGKRKNIYVCVLMISSAVEVGYAFIIGGAWYKWFGENQMFLTVSQNSLLSIVAFGTLLVLGLMTLRIILAIWGKVSLEWKQKYMNSILLLFLFLGSLVIGTVAFKKIDITNLFDWGRAWYDPAAIAFILLLCEIPEFSYENKKITRLALKVITGFLIFSDVIVSLYYTRGKLDYSYKCTEWSVYKNYFDSTIVPVFAYDERFGTLADGYTLWYTGKKPYDNYEYGAPYLFSDIDLTEKEEYIECFNLEDKFENQLLSAVYLNYINGVGNSELKMELYDKNRKCLGTLQQISPLSSKTIGFIADKPTANVSYIKIKTVEGENAYVTKDAYFVTKQ